jgi:hypothetical protein
MYYLVSNRAHKVAKFLNTLLILLRVLTTECRQAFIIAYCLSLVIEAVIALVDLSLR